MKNHKDVDVYDLGMTFIPNIGNKLARVLISHCGSPKEVFSKSQSFLESIPGIGVFKASKISDSSVLKRAEKELDFIQKNNIKALFYSNEDFPERLKHINDAPLILYFKGNGNLNNVRNLAIVGTRTPTQRGLINTEKFIEDLAPYSVNIWSGLAYGIDACAHKKCVKHNIPTIGVIACGLDRMYPAEHNSLARKMLENGGILTEFPSGTKPDRQNFPLRNRIIAAMSDAIIVIESKRKGGSMITAHLGNEYNKDVFAIPGRPDDMYAQGCNHLIKSSVSHLAESAEDLLYIMMWDKLDVNKTIQTSLFVELDDQEQKIIDKFKIEKEVGIDQLSTFLKLSPSNLAPILLNLEFKGLIKALPGKRYILVK